MRKWLKSGKVILNYCKIYKKYFINLEFADLKEAVGKNEYKQHNPHNRKIRSVFKKNDGELNNATKVETSFSLQL